MTRLLLCASLLAALCACGGDDDAPPPLLAATEAAVDDIVQTRLTADNLPGAVVLISIPGEGEMVKAYGKANLQTNQPRNAAEAIAGAGLGWTVEQHPLEAVIEEGDVAEVNGHSPLGAWHAA